jgi:hypothetical protein
MAGLSVSLYGSTGSPPYLRIGMPGYSRLGKGMKGSAPQWQQNDLHTFRDVEQQRFSIINAWNTVYQEQLIASRLHRIITPFRAVTNSGDVLSRKYYSCGGPCQTPQAIPNVYGLSQRFGAIQKNCDKTFVPAAACNVKYVYDSSDYSTYLKQKSILKNYNDLTYGGNDYHSGQSAYKAIRRY